MAGDFDPTERLDAISIDATDEYVLADGDRFSDDLPLGSERENNGSPLIWAAVAGVLLVASVLVIVANGRGGNDDGEADEGSGDESAASIADQGPAGTPVIGDPAASATGDGSTIAPDTSPPDEATVEPETTTSVPVADGPTDGTGTGTGTGVLVVGAPEITVSSDDFEIAVSTSACTTIEWTFAGDGQANAYDSGQDCYVDHVLSPRPEDPLQPATTYEVTASFVADGVREVVAFTVTTAEE
jgi:hypothetical protein